MNDVEQRLRSWLHAETPEPPRLLSVAQIIAAPEALDLPPVRPPRRRLWLPALAAAVVVVVVAAVLAAVAASRGNGHSKPATSSSPTQPRPSFTGGIAEPPADFAQTRLVGATGSYAWKLTDTLRLTADAGAHWSQVPLPSGLRPAAVDQIEAAADGTLFMVDSHRDQTLDLYRLPAGATQWADTTFAPKTPGTYAPPFLNGISADGQLVALLVDWGTMPTHAYSELFLSTDGGVTFTQRPTGLDLYTSDPLFLDAQTGLLVGGPLGNLIYRTADGGRHWTRVLGGPVQDDVTFGPPARSAAGVVVARVGGAEHGLEVTILGSTDQGTTFHPLAAPLQLRHPRIWDERFVSVLGDTVWVMTEYRIYETNDDGATWTSADIYQHIHGVELGSPTTAVGVASADCTSDTGGCWSTDYLVATTDGGRSWHSL